MYDVVLLTLGRAPAGGCGGAAAAATARAAKPALRPPAYAGAALRRRAHRRRGPGGDGHRLLRRARSTRCWPGSTARPAPDGLTWPDLDCKTRLVVATASDGQLRAVLRRLVRRYAPPPSRRPADLAGEPHRAGPAADRRAAAGPGRVAARDLVAQLGLPRDPAAVAAAVLGGRTRRLDLLRNDGGSVTLDGALLGAADDAGRPLPWRGRVEVDDAVLTDGEEPLLACAVGNAGGYADLDGLPLLADAGPGRRAGRGRGGGAGGGPSAAGAASGCASRSAGPRPGGAVTPRGDVPYLDDGVGRRPASAPGGSSRAPGRSTLTRMQPPCRQQPVRSSGTVPTREAGVPWRRAERPTVAPVRTGREPPVRSMRTAYPRGSGGEEPWTRMLTGADTSSVPTRASSHLTVPAGTGPLRRAAGAADQYGLPRPARRSSRAVSPVRAGAARQPPVPARPVRRPAAGQFPPPGGTPPPGQPGPASTGATGPVRPARPVPAPADAATPAQRGRPAQRQPGQRTARPARPVRPTRPARQPGAAGARPARMDAGSAERLVRLPPAAGRRPGAAACPRRVTPPTGPAPLDPADPALPAQPRRRRRSTTPQPGGARPTAPGVRAAARPRASRADTAPQPA